MPFSRGLRHKIPANRQAAGLLGIIFALVGIHCLIVLLQFYFLERRYQLALWKPEVTLNFIKIIAVHLCVFMPMAWLSINLQGSVWMMLVLAFCSGFLLLLTGVLAIPSYRELLFK